MKSIVLNSYDYLKRRAFTISWISLVVYVFYNTFIYYQNERQYYHLRNILGLGLCISRGTATVLNLSCSLVLLPLCKKMNRLLYRVLARLWPGLFFFWLESAKSFHMTVALTLVLFSVIHSASHFVNMWNFSNNYNDIIKEINFAISKDESPFRLLLSRPALTGVSMLMITTCMAMTSLRVVRRKSYNAFWYTHQLYLPFMVLLLIHPLSGVLKEEMLPTGNEVNSSQNATNESPKFAAIKSKTWQWMIIPLCCFFIDLMWRLLSRNRSKVDILEVTHMPGGTLSMTLSCSDQFCCRMGQYVLLQCMDISLLEWHPFTVVKVPTQGQRHIVVWIRVLGDWTKAFEQLLLERGPQSLSLLVDGPFSSPMERVGESKIAICIAAGVGITPFVALLQSMIMFPRSRFPGRLHLIWIVKHENELTWLADTANQAMIELRNANRPDRLQVEFYVTQSNKEKDKIHMVVVNEKGAFTHKLVINCERDEERLTLLTPHLKRNKKVDIKEKNHQTETVHNEVKCKIADKFPMLACRVRKGRPYWDRMFGYWVHLYPEEKLKLFCCGPKQLVRELRLKCKIISQNTKTEISLVHEGFS